MPKVDLLVDARDRANKTIADLKEANEYASEGVDEALAVIRRVKAQVPGYGRSESLAVGIQNGELAVRRARASIETTQDFVQIIGRNASRGAMLGKSGVVSENFSFAEAVITIARKTGHKVRDAANNVAKYLERN